jgi:hypothetical protein
MATQGSSIYGTFSCWFKLSNDNLTGGFLGHYFSNAYNFDICMQLGNIEVADYRTAYVLRKRTTAKYRDLNAWYHLYVAIDRSLATAADRCKIYVNGERITDFQSSEDQDYSQQTSGGHSGAVSMNNDYTARVGLRYGSSDFFDGSITHMHWVDGSVIDIAQFGSTDTSTGEWKINTSPTVADYGTNGFFILKDGNTITDQSSGGSYDFSLGGGTLTKTEDNASNNFATLNKLSSKGTFSYGNTEVEHSTGGTTYETTTTTLGMTSGKYYCEAKITYDNNYPGFGIASTNSIEVTKLESDWLGKTSNSYGYFLDGVIYNNGSTIASGQSTFATNDIIGMALDLDSAQNTLKFYKNGSLVNTTNITTNSNGWFFGTTHNNTKTAARSKFNFGNGYFRSDAVSSAGTNASNNGIFEYDVPSGYTALSTKGLNL